jgi:osmotically-inducible protein OsmY
MDSDIEKHVEMALFDDPATDSYEVNVSVKNGVVTLQGKVESFQEKELSAEVAKSVKGVIDLNNQISVNYKLDRSDFEILKDIQQGLKWNEWVDDGLIKVSVMKGEVTLTGVVSSAAEKREALRTSWVAGVKSVDNVGLNIAWWAKDTDLRANKSVQITDTEIMKAIMDAALYDPRVFSFNLDVDVIDRWVVLRGTVNNLRALKAAESLAKHTLGVVGVTNRIKVRSKKPISDKEVEIKIKSALASNSNTEPWEIGVYVSNGIVTLSGVVDSYIEKNEAEWVTGGVNGVISINNIIAVNYPYSYYWQGSYPYYEWYYPIPNPGSNSMVNQYDDEAIKRSVENEIWWSPYVSADQVDVSVKNGEVTLSGEVDSWRELRMAVENAWEGGALSIDNELVIF